MTGEILKETVFQPVEAPHFPTAQQLVVWRNWELVPVARLAAVLKTGSQNILDMASEMGLRVPPVVDDNWLKRGYITIIRNNWHLLPDEQLIALMGWTPEKLAYTLKEDDFLWIKLGRCKPDVRPVLYRALTEEERLRTNEIRGIVERYFPNIGEKEPAAPFDFLKELGNMEKPEKLQERAAGSMEIFIDESWTLSYPKDTHNVSGFVDEFITYMKNRWTVNLATATKKPGKPCIVLNITADSEEPSETHEISVEEKEIRITAVDEAGLLRGFQLLEEMMEQARGPFIVKGKIKRKTRFDIRYIYSYFAVYGDPLLEPGLDPYPDSLLLRLSKLGINGIWLQGILYNLVPWEEAPELSENWEKRIAGLNGLIERAGRYGIGVYLYLNEPRSMPLEFFGKYPQWKGHVQIENGEAALCTSRKAVKDYLKNGVARLFKEAPGLAGIFTITISENLTNCFSRAPQGKTNCPHCTGRSPQEAAAEVNRLIAEGAHSVKPDAKVICWTWGWSKFFGWDGAAIKEGIESLGDNVSVMCTSEEDIPFEIAGIKGNVIDYSISIPGPGLKAVQNWKYARARGLKSMAKVQLNNTWECSAVPYLPVPDLIEEHLMKLSYAGVSGLMLSWTLGGYPSLNLEIAANYYWEQEGAEPLKLDVLACRKFGDKAGIKVREAWRKFGYAFREFPFDLGVIYTAPQNFGPANLLYEKPTKKKATTVGFPYDDLESWRAIYPEDIFENQFKKLSVEWKKGLDVLLEAESDIESSCQKAFTELKAVAISTYCHFRSTYLQISYIRMRERLYASEDECGRNDLIKAINELIDEEIEIALMLHDIMRYDSRIGYEASNHYYYTSQSLREKVVMCKYLQKKFLQMKEQPETGG